MDYEESKLKMELTTMAGYRTRRANASWKRASEAKVDSLT